MDKSPEGVIIGRERIGKHVRLIMECSRCYSRLVLVGGSGQTCPYGHTNIYPAYTQHWKHTKNKKAWKYQEE